MMLYADDGGIKKNKKILKNKCIQKLCVQKLNYKNHKTWKINYKGRNDDFVLIAGISLSRTNSFCMKLSTQRSDRCWNQA